MRQRWDRRTASWWPWTYCSAAHQRGLPPPNVDAALGALTQALGAPVGSGELLFTIARTAGWVAHALEQYADPQLLRPEAVYTGR